MLMNTKYKVFQVYVFVEYDDKRGKKRKNEREKENRKAEMIKESST